MAIDRREFLAGIGGFGLGLGLGGVSHWLPLAPPRVGPDWAPGVESFISSTCTLCPAHCGIRGRLMDGRLVGIAGNPLHPVSRGGLCAKGVAGLQILYHPARLTGPVERTGPPGSGEFKPVTWDYALDLVATRLGELRDQGKSQSLMWLSGRTSGLMGDLVRHFARVYGTPHLIPDDYPDGASEVLRLSQGIDSPPAFDLTSSDYVLSFGVPLFEAWSGMPQAAAARDAVPGPRWVQVDVRHSRTAAGSDDWLAVRPGTYGLLALGFAYVILKEGIYDAERVSENVVGLEDAIDENGQSIPGFRSLVVRHGRTEQVAQRTGVPPETIIRIAKELGSARASVAVWDHAVSWRSGGLADALAIHALNILVGAIDRPGGTLVQPALPVPPAFGGQTTNAVPPPSSSFTRANWAALIGGESTPPPEALFMYYSNPVGSSPNGEDVVKALARIPLVVSFSPFLDESARHANLVLPDCTYLERWQDAPSPAAIPISVWSVVQPMIEPLHDTRSTGDVILDLGARLGGEIAASMPASSFEELVVARGKVLAGVQRGGVFDDELSRMELRELESRGWWVPHGQSESEFWQAVRERGGWFDPYYDYHDRSMFSRFDDGKARLFSLEARRRIGQSASEIAGGALPFELPQGEGNASHALVLNPYRVMTLASGGTALLPWLLENLGVMTGNAWETWIEINPETAREHDLDDGRMVRVESALGHFDARVRVFAGAQPGVVNVPYGLHTSAEGWGEVKGANPLQAVGNRLDATTGLPDWYSTRARVVPI